MAITVETILTHANHIRPLREVHGTYNGEAFEAWERTACTWTGKKSLPKWDIKCSRVKDRGVIARMLNNRLPL